MFQINLIIAAYASSQTQNAFIKLSLWCAVNSFSDQTFYLSTSHTHTLSLSLSLYIYIYISITLFLTHIYIYAYAHTHTLTSRHTTLVSVSMYPLYPFQVKDLFSRHIYFIKGSIVISVICISTNPAIYVPIYLTIYPWDKTQPTSTRCLRNTYKHVLQGVARSVIHDDTMIFIGLYWPQTADRKTNKYPDPWIIKGKQ